LTTSNSFRLPGGADRTVVIGMNGSGKTVGAAWLLSRQDFRKRPWVILDYKNEEFWDLVGDPPLRPLRLGEMPGKVGLYIMSVLPGDEDRVESWLWKVWHRENIGIVCDEVSLIPRKHAFKAILRQGRSKRIPVISCTQRPVSIDREVFSESQFKWVFNLEDARDYDVVKEFTRNSPVDGPLPEHWSYWYDGPKRRLTVLRPVPNPDNIARDIREKAPYSFWLGG
jgi:hypothetical protein